jgi:uncharacterized membrane protein YdjX (TVP38/TMEM64 family)
LPDTRADEDAPTARARGGEPPGERPPLRAILRGLWRPALVLVAIAIVVALVSPREIVDEIDETRQWFHERGLAGIAIFLGFYVLAAICLVPQSAMKIAAGAVFESALGIIVASLGSILGATACFLISRYVARGSLLQRMKKRPKFRRLDRMTAEHGPVIVAASRLVPIFPGNLLNYAFGLTQVRTKVFVLWSWLCMLPGIVVLVVGTDAAVQAVEEGRVPWSLVAVVGSALVAMIAATRIAYLRFRDKQEASDRAPSAGDGR